jgi:hypothetical protein
MTLYCLDSAQEVPVENDGDGQPNYTTIPLQFSEKAHSRLEEIKARAGITDNGEFFKNAVRIYEWFLQRRDEGCEILVRTKDGNETKIVEPAFDEPPAQADTDS